MAWNLQAKVVETDEFAQRLEALEERMTSRTTSPPAELPEQPLGSDPVSDVSAGVVGHC